MIRYREEDNERTEHKKIKTTSEHPEEGSEINPGNARSPMSNPDDTSTAAFVPRNVDTNNGGVHTDTTGPNCKTQDSDSDGPSQEVLRSREEFHAMKARAQQRREDRERIYGPMGNHPEEDTHTSHAMQLLLNATNAETSSVDTVNGPDNIVLRAAPETT
ncbi:hypothetical protein BC826DRAFT_974105 [Russula brevipes]|nr:hypothetical protein BC826DRAFT_974105 [Russula brevipes]